MQCNNDRGSIERFSIEFSCVDSMVHVNVLSLDRVANNHARCLRALDKPVSVPINDLTY